MKSSIRLSPLISDGMVIQRNSDVKIWGSAKRDDSISLSFKNQTYFTKTDEHGNWEIMLSNLKHGGPYDMVIETSNESVTIKDILVGDVWLLGGQSNMELPISRTLDLFENEVKEANNKYIRQFSVPQKHSFDAPLDEIDQGEWIKVTPTHVLEFSAVGYFFAKEIYKEYKIPVGLIHTAVGGTPAEAWIKEESLNKFERFKEEFIKCKSEVYVNEIKNKDERLQHEWYSRLNQKDPGLKGVCWYEKRYDDTSWDTINMPNSFKNTEIGDLKGTIWLRKKIHIPNHLMGKDLKMYLGTLVDGDETYFNGVKIGETGYRYPPRRYIIPKEIVNEGENIITVRLIITENTGEFIEDMPYYIEDESLPLSGTWQYKVGAITESAPSMTFFNYKPVGMYNGMIHPLRNFCINGVLWYQGESNTGNPFDYKELFTQVINDWRETFKEPELPFYYVQLANFMEGNLEPVKSEWAYLRDQQRQVLDVRNTGMAVIIDVGQANDLHPQDKETVGKRLALIAKSKTYGDKLVYRGPLYEKMEIINSKVHLYFKHIGSGLIKNGESLNQFTICGEDHVFVKAKAKIEDNKVIVYHETISDPIAVRYAWGDNPIGANLYNKEGLPASPFSTHDFGI